MSVTLEELQNKEPADFEQMILSMFEKNPNYAFSYDKIADSICGHFDVNYEVSYWRTFSGAQVFDYIRKVYNRLSLIDVTLSSMVARGKLNIKSVKDPVNKPLLEVVPGYITYFYVP